MYCGGLWARTSDVEMTSPPLNRLHPRRLRYTTQVGEIFDDVEDSFWFIHKLSMDVMNEHAPIKKRYILTTCRLHL